MKQQAIEAIAHDTASFLTMAQSLQSHPDSALLFPCLLPSASMYVVESRRALELLDSDVAALLSGDLADYVRQARHRAKLLDDAEKSVEQVAANLAEVADRQTQLFMEPHVGILGPLRRAIQPDLGLSTYESHIFSTTHATAFNFGDGGNPGESALLMGYAFGRYTSTLFTMLGLESPEPAPAADLPGEIHMRDIKSSALYGRGPLGQLPTELASGMTLLLVSMNSFHYIMRRLLPKGGHTQFRLKFIVAYHADSNLRSIQNRLTSSSSLPDAAADVIRETLGNADSRWLRKRSVLRNLLAHYVVDERRSAGLSTDVSRAETIEHFGGKLTYAEMDALLDRQIERTSRALERGFSLDGDPFWYGRVS